MKHFTFAFRRNERTLLVALTVLKTTQRSIKDKTQFELVKLVIHRDWSLHSALRVRGGGGGGEVRGFRGNHSIFGRIY